MPAGEHRGIEGSLRNLRIPGAVSIGCNANATESFKRRPGTRRGGRPHNLASESEKMGRWPMIELSANPALRTFVRTWSVILAASCGGMAVVVLLVLWAMTGFHGLGIDPVPGVALVLGSIGATALCVCLMGLLFYSDTSGRDEAISREARSEGD
jgi:hypothetical protein